MNLHVCSICLNGQPFVERHLDIFSKLPFAWHWHIREGQAQPIGCTRWCKSLKPSLSTDGTTEYLRSISNHPNVSYYAQSSWPGKSAMFADMTKHIAEPCILLQVDVDEIWTTDQLVKIMELFEANPTVGVMQFFCNYHVGENIVTRGENCYGNNSYEWFRAWRFEPGMMFKTHEPPVMNRVLGSTMSRDETKKHGLVFQHFAYATEAQLAYKQKFYGYKDAVAHWKRLQANTTWPVEDLRLFLPWVGANVRADKI